MDVDSIKLNEKKDKLKQIKCVKNNRNIKIPILKGANIYVPNYEQILIKNNKANLAHEKTFVEINDMTAYLFCWLKKLKNFVNIPEFYNPKIYMKRLVKRKLSHKSIGSSINEDDLNIIINQDLRNYSKVSAKMLLKEYNFKCNKSISYSIFLKRLKDLGWRYRRASKPRESISEDTNFQKKIFLRELLSYNILNTAIVFVDETCFRDNNNSKNVWVQKGGVPVTNCKSSQKIEAFMSIDLSNNVYYNLFSNNSKRNKDSYIKFINALLNIYKHNSNTLIVMDNLKKHLEIPILEMIRNYDNVNILYIPIYQSSLNYIELFFCELKDVFRKESKLNGTIIERVTEAIKKTMEKGNSSLVKRFINNIISNYLNIL